MFLVRKDNFTVGTVSPYTAREVDGRLSVYIEEKEIPEWVYHLLLALGRCDELDAVLELEGKPVTKLGTKVYDIAPSDDCLQVEMLA